MHFTCPHAFSSHELWPMMTSSDPYSEKLPTPASRMTLSGTRHHSHQCWRDRCLKSCPAGTFCLFGLCCRLLGTCPPDPPPAVVGHPRMNGINGFHKETNPCIHLLHVLQSPVPEILRQTFPYGPNGCTTDTDRSLCK